MDDNASHVSLGVFAGLASLAFPQVFDTVEKGACLCVIALLTGASSKLGASLIDSLLRRKQG
jgi:hypothetical protein